MLGILISFYLYNNLELYKAQNVKKETKEAVYDTKIPIL